MVRSAATPKRQTKISTEAAILRRLHPALAAWFEAHYPGLSEIQQKALPYTLAGSNTLILAPTGSGKTLAAFLGVLSRLAERASKNALPNAVCAIYVSPLKALDNDIFRNLSPALEALNESLPARQQIAMEVRTGDTAQNDRNRQRRSRPHLILTTPESLSSILSQAAWRETGFDPDTVVIDEIHSFAENKRGSLAGRLPGAFGTSGQAPCTAYRRLGNRVAHRSHSATALRPSTVRDRIGRYTQITSPGNCASGCRSLAAASRIQLVPHCAYRCGTGRKQRSAA